MAEPVEAPGIIRANLKALIVRVMNDSRMSAIDAACFVEMTIGNELRECAAEMAKAEAEATEP